MKPTNNVLTFDIAGEKRRARNLSVVAVGISVVVLGTLMADILWPACIYLAVVITANVMNAVNHAADMRELEISQPDERGRRMPDRD